MAIGSLWKNDDHYIVQFNNVTPREKSFIKKNFNEWKEAGNGFHKDGTEILLFLSREQDEKKIFSLVKDMPFPFTEEKKNGQSKTIRTKYAGKRKGLTAAKSCGKIRKARTCSKCGDSGHDSRNCRQ